MKKIIFTIMTCILALAMIQAAFAGETERETRGSRGGQDGSGGMEVTNDAEIKAALDEAADRFIQNTFIDPDTGFELEYSLYIPEGYVESQAYPMIMFIPDSTGSGLSAAQLVSNYFGAAVWATDEEQAKHPSFVFVPAFSETVVDDNWNTSDQIETAVKTIDYLTQNYSIDTDRLYTTGQSMGCMTSLYLNSIYPDLFAASLFVSGQWDINVLQGLEEKTFFYITSAGDSKASGGQNEVMAMFDADGVSYSYGEWNCKDEDQSEKAEELIAEGFPANMIRFDAEYIDDSGNNQSLGHMQSFNYAYKIEAVRDWLFAQSK